MSSKIVNIVRIVRRMRGGSQSWLVEGCDGHFYVAKFTGNPQGTRTLINEWIGTHLLQQLGVCTPEVRVLRLSGSTLATCEEMYFEGPGKKVSIKPGLHFGSTCPCDPTMKAIFDFMPRRLLDKVVNIEDFTKVFVLDHLLGHSDYRQAIFVREPHRTSTLKLRAYMIDHGMLFGGSNWEVSDLPLAGCYRDWAVYSRVDIPALVSEALQSFPSMTAADLKLAVRDIPRDWVGPRDIQILESLFERLQTRRSGRESLVMRHFAALGRERRAKDKAPKSTLQNVSRQLLTIGDIVPPDSLIEVAPAVRRRFGIGSCGAESVRVVT